LHDAYRIEAFEVNIAQRIVLCPEGFQSTLCSRINETGRKVVYRFEWSYHCKSCPLRADCVPTAQKHHSIVVGKDHDFYNNRRKKGVDRAKRPTFRPAVYSQDLRISHIFTT
jgi:hypothetical protein